MKRCSIWLMIVVSMLAFVSCEDENDNEVYNRIIGSTWVGDLGFNVGAYPVESGVTFHANDYAIDEQYYFPQDGGGRAVTLDLRWWISRGNLYLDYGKGYPALEIRDVFVNYNEISGALYANGQFEYYVTLYRDR